MFAVLELSHAVKTRRSDMGLTQTALSALSGLSRATVNQVENGTINDLSLTRTARLLGVLGLTLWVTPARPKSKVGGRPKTPPLSLAARTASVSYRNALMPETLEHALLNGEVPAGFVPHMNALLEDASVALLAAVVEQLHAKTGVERSQLWSTLRSLAQPTGEIDIVVGEPLTETPFDAVGYRGRTIRVETCAEIIAKKFWYRGDRAKARDLYDLCAVDATEPDAIAVAAPFMRRHGATFLKILHERSELLRADFEQIDVMGQRRWFDACLLRATAIIAQLI